MKLTVVIKGSHSRVLRYTSLSAKRDGAADDVKAARRSWSRVAKTGTEVEEPSHSRSGAQATQNGYSLYGSAPPVGAEKEEGQCQAEGSD